MFIRRSTYQQLLDRIEQLVDQRDAAEADAQRYLGAAKQAAQAFTCTDEQVAALRRQLDEMRQQRDRAVRRVDRLQAQYDDAVGLNSLAISDGAHWQERRHDKPRTVTS
jgi:uncharacterized protein (DUF3084 family)